MNTFLNMGVNVCNMKVWLHEQLCGYMWVNMCESVCVCDWCVCVYDRCAMHAACLPVCCLSQKCSVGRLWFQLF